VTESKESKRKRRQGGKTEGEPIEKILKVEAKDRDMERGRRARNRQGERQTETRQMHKRERESVYKRNKHTRDKWRESERIATHRG